jgi:uncharacterized protein YacL
MRLLYNPKHIGNKVQMWKGFLLGSMVTSALVYFTVTSSDVIVFCATLAMIVAGVGLFIKTCTSWTEHTFAFQNLFFAAIGAIVSLILNVMGILPVYLAVILILVLVTWLHRYRLRSKGEKEGKGKQDENLIPAGRKEIKKEEKLDERDLQRL